MLLTHGRQGIQEHKGVIQRRGIAAGIAHRASAKKPRKLSAPNANGASPVHTTYSLANSTGQ
jgi:hypothetical protein